MNDLISRRAAIQAIDDLPNCYNGYSDTYDKAYIIGVLEEVPTIEPKRGKWVERGENDDGTHNIQCSACEAGYKSKGHANSIYTKQRFHFCPNCGADMRERSEDVSKPD